jgi:hypothetical protein
MTTYNEFLNQLKAAIREDERVAAFLPIDNDAVVGRCVPCVVLDAQSRYVLCALHPHNHNNIEAISVATIGRIARRLWENPYCQNEANSWQPLRQSYRFASDDGRRVAVFGRMGTHSFVKAEA